MATNDLKNWPVFADVQIPACKTFIALTTGSAAASAKKVLEVPGFEPGTFRMQSGYSTSELHPLLNKIGNQLEFNPIVLKIMSFGVTASNMYLFLAPLAHSLLQGIKFIK